MSYLPKLHFFTELADTDIKGKLYLNHRRDRAEEPECLPDSTKSSLDGVRNLVCIEHRAKRFRLYKSSFLSQHKKKG